MEVGAKLISFAFQELLREHGFIIWSPGKEVLCPPFSVFLIAWCRPKMIDKEQRSKGGIRSESAKISSIFD